MSQNEKQHIGLRVRIFGSCLLVAAAACLGIAGDLPQLPVQTFVCALILCFQRRPFPFTDRHIVYTILATVAIVTFTGYFFPMHRGRLGMMSFFFRPEYYGGFVLLLPLAAGLFGVQNLFAAFVLMGTMIAIGYCGDVMDLSRTNTRLPVFDTLLTESYMETYSRVVLAMFAGILVFMNLLVRERDKARPEKKGPFWRKVVACAVALLVLRIGWSLVSSGKNLYLTNIQRIIMWTPSVNNMTAGRWQAPVFNGDVNLNMPWPLSGGRKADKVILRVVGEPSPERLRLYCMVNYSNGVWMQKKEPSEIPLEASVPEGVIATSSYFRKDLPPLHSWEIYRAGGLNAVALPVPQNFSEISIVAENVILTENGQMMPEQWKMPAGYTASSSDDSCTFSLPEPEAALSDFAYRDVPKKLYNELDDILKDIPGFSGKTTDAERCECLASYFSSHFTYRLPGRAAWRWRSMQENENEEKRNPDPTLDFLLRTHAGHCELFASATVLLLRRAGIPARYVTGFLCSEKAPGADYYAVRLRHAHAWVEYFDRNDRKWVCLDTTPGNGVAPELGKKWNAFDWVIDKVCFIWSKLLASMHRGTAAQAITRPFVAVWQMLVTPGGILVMLLVLAGGAYYVVYRFKKRHSATRLTQEQLVWREKYSFFYKKICKNLDIKEDMDYFTSCDLLERIQLSSKMSAEEKKEAKRFLYEYQAHRFGKQQTGGIQK